MPYLALYTSLGRAEKHKSLIFMGKGHSFADELKQGYKPLRKFTCTKQKE